MISRARELSQNAADARNEGELLRAGNLYTASAHEYLGTVTEHIFPEVDRTYAAVSQLCYAAMCYRIAGDTSRVQNRCDMGILAAKDYLEFIDRQQFDEQSFGHVRCGAWPEFIGDLRTIGKRDDAGDAYDRARDVYESAGDWEIVMGEQEHMRLTSFFYDVRVGLGHTPSDESDIELRPLGPTFTDWLEYKRERLSQLLDELEAQGEWPTD